MASVIESSKNVSMAITLKKVKTFHLQESLTEVSGKLHCSHGNGGTTQICVNMCPSMHAQPMAMHNCFKQSQLFLNNYYVAFWPAA